MLGFVFGSWQINPGMAWISFFKEIHLGKEAKSIQFWSNFIVKASGSLVPGLTWNFDDPWSLSCLFITLRCGFVEHLNRWPVTKHSKLHRCSRLQALLDIGKQQTGTTRLVASAGLATHQVATLPMKTGDSTGYIRSWLSKMKWFRGTEHWSLIRCPAALQRTDKLEVYIPWTIQGWLDKIICLKHKHPRLRRATCLFFSSNIKISQWGEGPSWATCWSSSSPDPHEVLLQKSFCVEDFRVNTDLRMGFISH